MLKDILVDVKYEGYNNDMQANSYKKINWLKSLSPQNHNKWHSIYEKPVYPCDILYKAPNGNIFLFKYMENGRPVDSQTHYLHSFDDGEWMYLKDIESQSHLEAE